MGVFKALNSGIAFGLELALLGAVGYWAFGLGAEVWARWLLALGGAGLVAVIWGLFFAPKAARRLSLWPGALLSLGLFLLGALALYLCGQTALAWAMAFVAVANRALVLIWKQW